jgi:hypothetical protein
LIAGVKQDGSGADAFGTVYADTPEQGRAVVDAYHAAGFQQMKLYTLIKPDVAGAIIRRAPDAGSWLAAECSSSQRCGAPFTSRSDAHRQHRVPDRIQAAGWLDRNAIACHAASDP